MVSENIVNIKEVVWISRSHMKSIIHIRIKVDKTSIVLNSAEHENFSANKHASCHFHIYWQSKFHAQLRLARIWNLLAGQISFSADMSAKNVSITSRPASFYIRLRYHEKKVREKSRECHNHKPQPFSENQEEEETDKSKQAQIDQTYVKH